MFYSLLITLESVLLQVCKKPIELVLQDLFRWNDAISVLPALPTKSASLVICVNSLSSIKQLKPRALDLSLPDAQVPLAHSSASRRTRPLQSSTYVM